MYSCTTVNEVGSAYKYGFVTDLESEKAPLGLNEDIVKSEKKIEQVKNFENSVVFLL